MACKTDGSTIDCGSGSSTYCCVNKKERCTGTKGQAFICWHNSRNTLNNFTFASLQEVHQSLSANQPDATTLPFDPIALAAQTAAPTTSSTTSSTSVPTITPPVESTLQPPPDTGLAPGAIAGIVVGIMAAVAILGVGGFFVWRKRRRDAEPMPLIPASYYEPKIYVDSPDMPRHELVSDYKGTELPGQSEWGPAELPAPASRFANHGWNDNVSATSVSPTSIAPDSFAPSPSSRVGRRP